MKTPGKYIHSKRLSRQPDSINFTYTGHSMNPLLKTGYLLKVIPYDGRKIRCGDVIVFLSPQENNLRIAHRVISINSQEIKTKGDNNRNVDFVSLTPEDIVGRAVYAQRGNRRLNLYGGLIGQLFAIAVRISRSLDFLASLFLRDPYHRLAQSGIFRRWRPAWMETRIFSFNRPSGTELQLLMGKRVIGRRRPAQTQWQIQRPFRLFVDVSALP